VILTSNPRNPTGRVVANPQLAEIQDLCRERATFISDEFYSGYNYTSNCDGTTISAAVSRPWRAPRLGRKPADKGDRRTSSTSTRTTSSSLTV